MSLHYVNLINYYCRNDYIYSSPNIDSVVDTLTPLYFSQFLSDDNLRKMVNINASSEASNDFLSSSPELHENL